MKFLQTSRHLLFFVLLLLLSPSFADAGFSDFFRKALTQPPSQLTEGRISEGLKEALVIGVNKAIERTGRRDGYFENPAIKILLPAKIRKVEPMLRKIGLGDKLDEWMLSMNRAAEAAAPQAKDLFLGALKQMTLEDVQKIYRGSDTAATEFFKIKTAEQLAETYKPLVLEAMSKYEVTRVYQEISAKIPLGLRLNNASLENYVTAKALDGLFITLGDQERAIRKDPAARVTELLKEVFAQ